MNHLLEINKICIHFGGIIALNNISLAIEAGKITAIIGPNGAGKTTLFNCMTGFYKPTSGRILFQGRPIHHLSTVNIARMGICRTFQHSRVFKEMTVIENLLIAQQNQFHTNFINALLNTNAYKFNEQNALKKAQEWLKLCNLHHEANHLACNLSYGKQRILEIIRAMCMNPKVLCLDEPAAGLNPTETIQLKSFLKKLNDDFQTTILLIEHDMSLIMSLSNHIFVLDQGTVIAEGNPTAIQSHPKVIEAYLGSQS